MAKSLNDLTDGELHDVSKNALVVAQASPATYGLTAADVTAMQADLDTLTPTAPTKRQRTQRTSRQPLRKKEAGKRT